MNRPKTIISFALFFSIILFIMQGIGESIRDDEHPYIRSVAIGTDDSYYPNTSYAHLWENKMDDMGIDIWQPGEYDKSDRINFEGVYHSTKSYSEKFASSSGNNIAEGIANFFGELFQQEWQFHNLDWDHGTMKNISEGEQIYIYPHIWMNIPGGDAWKGLNIEQYIYIRAWDAYSASQEWVTGLQSRDVSGSGDKCEWIPRLDAGVMGKYDLYYVIDVAYFDQDFLHSIPGINLFTNIELEELIDSDKALYMERWGGVIYGDNHNDIPTTLSYHEMTYKSQGGISTFFDTIKDIQIGWAAFTNTGNDIVNIGFTSIFSVFALAFGLCIYYEIKSYLPFISGGEGGE